MLERVTTMLIADSTLPAGHPDHERTETVVRDFPVLVVNRAYITADGIDTALVTYDDPSPTPPTSVTFTVNGASVVVDVDADGVAELELSTTAPGPIVVTDDVLNQTLTITADMP